LFKSWLLGSGPDWELAAIILERKIGQQEEAEGAEEERFARIGGVTCQVGMEVLHDSFQ
jgi:hypothetical protein